MSQIIAWTKSQKAYVFGKPVPLHHVLLVLLFAAIWYGVSHWNNRDNWSTLVHEQYNFSIDYPTNWAHATYGVRGNKNLTDEKAHFYTNQIGFLGLVSKALSVNWFKMENPTPEKIYGWDLERHYRSGIIYSDFQEVEAGSGNYPAWTRTVRYATTSQIRIQYFIIRDDNIYLLEFFLRNSANKDEAFPIFDHMLASFNITP
ncbi:MAG: hypothetical protein CL608_33725 [Anaerolineaceae bacterium]|nr:hypothetical protein [Anaerolineaceae bacterium]